MYLTKLRHGVIFMSLVQELEALIKRTGSYQDRLLLIKVLEVLKKNNYACIWS
jgi:hypothetical protein